MTQPEAGFKKRLRDGFKTVHADHPHYWLPLVASMMQKSGIPDLFVADGKIGCWIEAKVNGNGLSNLQNIECRKLAMAGQIVVVLHCDLDKVVAERRIDRSQFTKDGMVQYQPNLLAWADTATVDFWRGVIHGPV